MQTVGVALIKLLEEYGVQNVFGIPGVHTIELYRGLAESSITHHTPRHEQGAGFMADGYARISGQPGVCFVITGPGLTNIATAMGQALADSIPMLVISSVNDHISSSISRGHLHELPDQAAMIANVCRYSQTISDAQDLSSALATAFAVFSGNRPGPVHLQIPIAVLGQLTDHNFTVTTTGSAVPVADEVQIENARLLLQSALKPVLLIGGGARHASAELIALAEKLDAPAHMTINARGVIPDTHPLALPASGSMQATRNLINTADVVFAIGTELAPTDYDMYRDDGFKISGRIIRCDIDLRQIHLNYQPDVTLLGDAKAVVKSIADRLTDLSTDTTKTKGEGAQRTRDTMNAAAAELGNEAHIHLQLLQCIKDKLPDSVMVGDSTQLIYSGNMIHNSAAPNRWFNSSVGFGTLGYALPASIGAAIALQLQIKQQEIMQQKKTQQKINNHLQPSGDSSVVCLIGDGGLQFVLGELGTLKDSGVHVAIIVWCNEGYREIKTSMENAGVTSVGVELVVPDFASIANAYGIESTSVASIDKLSAALDTYQSSGESILITIDEQDLLSSHKIASQ